MVSDIYQSSDISLSETIVTMVKRIPTSIKIDEQLWEDIKILAIRKKTTATELLELAMRDLLAKEAKTKSKK
jgi:predicted DNA-binding ribbon-helix-helix protein